MMGSRFTRKFTRVFQGKSQAHKSGLSPDSSGSEGSSTCSKKKPSSRSGEVSHQVIFSKWPLGDETESLAGHRAVVQAYAKAIREYVNAPRDDPAAYYATLGPYRDKVESLSRVLAKSSVSLRAEIGGGVDDGEGMEGTNTPKFWRVMEDFLRRVWAYILQVYDHISHVWDPDMPTIQGVEHYSSSLQDGEYDAKEVNEEMEQIKVSLKHIIEERPETPSTRSQPSPPLSLHESNVNLLRNTEHSAEFNPYCLTPAHPDQFTRSNSLPTPELHMQENDSAHLHHAQTWPKERRR